MAILYKGCLYCQFFKKNSSCKAFPESIPLAILSGDVEHTKKLAGQTGETIYKEGKFLGNM